MKKVLVCPLDWGLGHATRCIPVIRELQRQGADVSIASSGAAFQLLKLEFPSLTMKELPSYRPVYPSRGSMALRILIQIPRFRNVIRREHEQIERWVREQKIDAVISDNRFGCWSSAVKSVFITHQTIPIMPSGYSWATPVVRNYIRKFVTRFDEVWIPDQPDSGMTASFNEADTSGQKYIGWLSRFNAHKTGLVRYDILALVSGPEPQRTIFEKLILNQLKQRSDLKTLLVSGRPDIAYRNTEGNVEIVNHLTGTAMEEALAASALVISRSGYSTIMDLIALGKKAIFVPTPQQTEQLFLATYCSTRQLAYSMTQENFTLETALEKSSLYKGFSGYSIDNSRLVNAVSTLLQ